MLNRKMIGEKSKQLKGRGKGETKMNRKIKFKIKLKYKYVKLVKSTVIFIVFQIARKNPDMLFMSNTSTKSV